MTFITDVTIPDNTQISSGASFTKTWRLQNSGSCSWSNYSAVFISNPTSGNPSVNLNSSGATSVSVPTTSAGQTIDFSIGMRAPSSPGTYYSYWQLQNASGSRFGVQFYVKIIVPQQPPPCSDGMTFITDVTIPDNTQISANASFTKTWRLQNSGTCSWSNYTAVFISNPTSGNPSINLNSSGATSVSVPTTSAGQTIDFSIGMRAPTSPGTYYSYWQLQNASGSRFGVQFYVKIIVPQQPPPCSDGMTFITDVTIPDNTQISASASFTKTWRLQNSGTCSWSNYSAVFISNPTSGNPSVNLNSTGATSVSVPTTSAGQTIDFSIPMRAPSTPGTYYSYWQLQNASGSRFGVQFYVKIIVPQQPPPCSDGMTFITDVTIPDNTQISSGASFTKTWRLQNSGSCSWSNYSAVFISNPTSGNPSVNLNSSGATSVSVPTTSAGQTIDFSIGMRAPSSPGTYYSYWQLQNASGSRFGVQFYVKIIVPQQPPPCFDGMTFITDVTIPDNTQISANASFTKTWRLQDSGSCSWTNYTAVFISNPTSGNPSVNLNSSGAASVSVPTTSAGQTIDFSIAMRAPSTPGTYYSYWQLQNASGSRFGVQFYVKIIVPQQPPPCFDGMTFITDVTIPDNTQISANASFTKTWRLQNSGSCSWTNYTAVFISNPTSGNPSVNLNSTGATSVPVPTTSAGQTIDFSIPMRAPSTSGTYYSYWQLQNASGTRFGVQFYVKIIVPTTPQPDFTVSASPSSRTINQGDATNYTITVTSQSGFNGSVALNALNLPGGIALAGTAFNPQTVNVPSGGSANSTFNYVSNTTVPTGPFTVTMQGQGSGLTRSTTVSLIVTTSTDNVRPTVNSFSVSPTSNPVGGTFTVSYSISDSGGSGLNRAELWRAPDSGSVPGTWSNIRINSHSGSGPASSSFSDSIPSAGRYWYGIHVFDGAGNQTNEPSPPGPIRVTVESDGGSQRPVATFTFSPSSPTTGQPVQFTNSSTGGGLSSSWDFNGDGVVDSAATNPTHSFATSGPYQVTLNVANAYGSNSITRAVNVASVSGEAPVIALVTRQYPGVFLEGSTVNLRFDVRVDWKGAPGRVTFSVNGGSPTSEVGNSNGAAHTFQIGRDFAASLTPSTVTIIPINAAGIPGTPWIEYLYVFRLPLWLQEAIARDPSSLAGMFDVGRAEYTISLEFPKPHLGENKLLYVPRIVPYLGDGPFGMRETYVTVKGKVSTIGTGSLSAYGKVDFLAMGNSLSAELGGSGQFQLSPPRGLILTGASFNINLKGTMAKEEGILTAIPTLAPLTRLSIIGGPIKRFSDLVMLRMEISPSLNTTFHFAQNAQSGRLAFSDGTAKIGVDMKASIKANFFERLTAEAWVGGGGSFTLGVPEPFVREAEFHAQAGVKFSLDALFTTLRAQAVFNFGCKLQSGTSWDCFTGGSSEGPIANVLGDAIQSGLTLNNDDTVSLIQTDYTRFGNYSVFKPIARRKMPSTSVPLSVQETTLVSNVFPGALPAILEVGIGKLLLWEHQNPALPIPQSTNISWSFNNGSTWSTPSVIADDTRVELSPVLGLDSSQKVVAAWLRIKDTSFSTPINTTGDLPLFYTRLEVVSAVFDPPTRTWGPVLQLTDDSAFDTDLHLSSDTEGHLLLTWLSNPTGEFTSTSSSPSILKFSVWNGSNWSTPAVIASGLTGVSGHVSAIKGSKAFVVLPHDHDLAAAGKSALDMYSWNGSIWTVAASFADAETNNASPAAVFDVGGEGHIVWLRGSDLVHATLSKPSAEIVRSGSSSMGFYDAKLLINSRGNLTLLWRQSIDNGPANIFAILYDPNAKTWSADRRLSEDPALAYDLSAYYGSDGQIHAAYLNTQIDRVSETVLIDGKPQTITNIPKNGRTDLQLLEHSLIVDLAISDKDLTVSPQAPQSNEAVTATVDVHNAGDFAVSNFLVNLYSGSPEAGGLLVGSSTVSEPLAAGNHRVLTYSFNYPATGGNLVAIVDPNGSTSELTKTNNRATIYLTNMAPEAQVLASITSGAGPLKIDFDGTASSDSEGDAMTFSWSFADGSPSVNGPKVSHTFTEAGEYPVTLSVTDSHGAVGTALVVITVSGNARTPRINDARVSGKKLFVSGANFDDGAKILLAGDLQKKTVNDDANPTTILIGNKAGKLIAPGQTVTLQVRNSDGTLSPVFSFTRTQ